MPPRTYIAIDLKSFYASVECVDRKLDPLTSNLVVADLSRTEKTICLAVSPALKGFGVPGRPRLFEVVEKVRMINAERLQRIPGHAFTRKSSDATELKKDRRLELDYIVAVPRMSRYMQMSSQIYSIYLTVTGDLRFSAARIPASGHALPGWCVIGLRNPDPGGKIQRRKNGAGHGHRFHVLRRLDNTVLSTVFPPRK